MGETVLVPIVVALTRGVKSSGRVGEELNFCKDFKVPGSNLACTPFVVSFSLCFSTSRRSDITRTRSGGREFLQNSDCQSVPVSSICRSSSQLESATPHRSVATLRNDSCRAPGDEDLFNFRQRTTCSLSLWVAYFRLGASTPLGGENLNAKKRLYELSAETSLRLLWSQIGPKRVEVNVCEHSM